MKLSVYLHYFKSVGPLVSITVLVLNFIYQGLSVGTNIWLSDWSSDREIYINGTLNTARRDMYLEGYGLFGLVQGMFYLSINQCKILVMNMFTIIFLILNID